MRSMPVRSAITRVTYSTAATSSPAPTSRNCENRLMRVLCVVGARPNFMKVKPVMDALAAIGLQALLVHTGQHYGAAMSDVFFDDLGLRRPDYYLGAGSGSHAAQTSAVMLAFEPVIDSVRPDAVIVAGDVNST